MARPCEAAGGAGVFSADGFSMWQPPLAEKTPDPLSLSACKQAVFSSGLGEHCLQARSGTRVVQQAARRLRCTCARSPAKQMAGRAQLPIGVATPATPCVAAEVRVPLLCCRDANRRGTEKRNRCFVGCGRRPRQALRCSARSSIGRRSAAGVRANLAVARGGGTLVF